MITQFPSSCLLGHITGLFFSIYIKICHPCILQMTDCWFFFRRINPEERIQLVALDIVCSEGKIVKELGIFKDGSVLVYIFLPPRDYKPTFQAKWNIKNIHGIHWNNEKLDHAELASIIHQHCSQTTEYFAKRLEKCNILTPYLCKDVEHLDFLVVWRLPNYWKTIMLIGSAATTSIHTRRL